MKNNIQSKIGLFLDDSRISGVSIYTKNLANYLKINLKIPCDILMPKKNSTNFVKQLKQNKISYKFYNIERISKNTIIDFLIFIFFKKKKLISFFEKNLYKIYIVQGSLQFLNIFILNSLKKDQIIVINDSYMNLVFKFVLKYIVKKKTKVIFVSKCSRNFYKNTFLENNKIVVPTGVNFKKKITKKFKKKIFTIGTSCNVNPDKNILFLLKVAKILKDQNLNVNIKIAGNIYKSQRSYYKILKEEIKKYKLNNVEFLGFKKNINYFLKNLDLYCCFSKSESSPLSVWEAMHHGLPIITTDVGDLKYHINRGKFGYVIENYNEIIYAQKIKKILCNMDVYNQFSRSAINYSQKNFNQDKNLKILFNFIFSNSKFLNKESKKK